jgi:16S rRNA (adenine1518-N6/adenine1519-N6)-dimethyltransferase
MALRDLCQQYGIQFKKQLGQNLLLDDNINRIMVRAAELTRADDVIEVGAGLGALTTHLAAAASRVLAIEIDPAFMPCLEDRFGADERVRLFRGDVLNHSLGKLVDEYLPGGASYKMVSNLPYYITTPLLFHFWEAPVHFRTIVVMVQEEVGSRMTAPVDSPDYGVLSIAARLYANTDVVHKAPRTCFRPQPEVDSCVVRMRLRESPLFPNLDVKFLMSVARTAFQHRRKTLRNSLTKSGAFGAPKDAVLEAFEAAGIDPARRPQTLSLDEFAVLARAIRARI